ncbi:hypothetical protein ACJMK2_023755 [Sinanodonta woodiana]|uniref:EF-hand domain-containing protein n=1 Tax=Sinanodonta woodiana TaxID=1069815 RepID=A0ABD3T5F5_SINWO
MQQQQGAMGMGPQGPSQPYNISECNAWQEYEFYTQDELHQVFMMEVSRNPETLAQQALDTEGLMNVMNNTPNISNYYVNWSREVFSIMIAKFGHSRDGFMQWPEFLELQEHLVHWFDNFMQYDVNRSGFIAGQELVVSIISTLFEQTAIDNTTVITLIKRFSKKTCLAFDGFVSVCVRLRAYTDVLCFFHKPPSCDRQSNHLCYDGPSIIQCTVCILPLPHY